MDAASATVVKLSVGGVFYETTIATLTADKDSMLASMFSGRWTLPITEDGYKFIDRNGSVFCYILDYLRGSKLLPSDREILDRLNDEATYYTLSGLLSAIEDHDMNSRKVSVVYMERQFEFRLDQLRKERHSALAVVATHIYEHKSGSLELDLTPLSLPWSQNNIGSNNSAISIPKYQIVDRPFHDFWSTISTKLRTMGSVNDIFQEYNRYTAVRSAFYKQYYEAIASEGDTRQTTMLVRCALIAIENYLKDNELSLDSILESELKNALPPSATLEQLFRELRDERFVEKIVQPAVYAVAIYFGLSQLAQTLVID